MSDTKQFAYNLKKFGFKARNFKCFDDWQGVDGVFPINLIVGRNNAGKSTVLDLVQAAVTGELKSDQRHERATGQKSELYLDIQISDDMVEALISSQDRRRTLAKTRCLGLHARSFVGPRDRTAAFDGENEVKDDTINGIVLNLQHNIGNPLRPLIAVRLRADRDIRAENHGAPDHLGENGENATQMIESYVNSPGRRAVVEKTILPDLNAILEPDWKFKSILALRPDSKADVWELSLVTEKEAEVSLSQMGSGVKTLLLVLIELHLVPLSKGKSLKEFVFCFEELENNLHPAVQRRLFRYLRQKAIKDGCLFFLTTHSSAVIDLFGDDDQAQLLHVTNDQTKATVQRVSTHSERCHILDDLDVRASDLLQANVLVWVEGPSDRLYFNRWVELWTDGQLEEQVHYQCIWYGGALLAGMSFEEVEEEDAADSPTMNAFVAALSINRHAIVLMDSDRRSENGRLKKRVQRIDAQLATTGVSWITAGREVENYLDVKSLRDALSMPDLLPTEQYADVFGHIEKYRKRKVDLAHKIVPRIARELLQQYDLPSRLEQVCNQIRKWNGLPEITSHEKARPNS